MTIYVTHKGNVWTAWIQRRDGTRIYEASGNSLELAVGRLVYALSQRDDPAAKPRVRIVEK
jgi:hypothetical protein